MAEAFAWGALASTSLIAGGLIALRVRVSNLVLGLVMAFGAGVLISAVAYELVLEAFETSSGSGEVALGLFAGCAAFSVGDLLIDRLGGDRRKRSDASVRMEDRRKARPSRSCWESCSTAFPSRS